MKCLLTIILMLVCFDASAFTIYRTDWGVTINEGNYSVDDPNGSTKSTNKLSIAPVAAFVIGKESRIWTELHFNNFNLGYGTNDIGQSVKSTEFKMLYQHFLIRNSSPTVFYYSVGWSLSKNQYTDRSTVDSGGFIAQQYGNRDVFNSDLYAGVGVSHKLTDTMTLGAGANLLKSIDHGIDGFMVNVYCLFRGTPLVQ